MDLSTLGIYGSHKWLPPSKSPFQLIGLRTGGSAAPAPAAQPRYVVPERRIDEGTEEEARELFVLYKKMADTRRDPAAQYNTGLACFSGRGVEKDDKLALVYYQLSAEQGYVRALLKIGEAYDTGSLGLERDVTKAFQYAKIAAEAGHPESAFNCGIGYMRGNGVEKSEEEATRWLRKAAALGDADARYLTGDIGGLLPGMRAVAGPDVRGVPFPDEADEVVAEEMD